MSLNENIRDLWEDSSKSNVRYDALLLEFSIKQAQKIQKNSQAKKAIDRFLNLGSQGKIALSVSEIIPAKQITLWSNTVTSLPGHIHNFVRKAIQSQLTTLHNSFRWGRAPFNLCPLCNKDQTKDRKSTRLNSSHSQIS